LPKQLILTTLEQQTRDYLKSVREEASISTDANVRDWYSMFHSTLSVWDPYWHLEFFAKELNSSPEYLFDQLFQLSHIQHEGQMAEPENYFSLAYLIANYLQ
jgi:hypothetical protein